MHRIDKVATTTIAFYGEKPRTRKEVEDVGNVYQDYFFYESDTLHSMLNCTRIIQFYFLHESPLSIGLIRPTTASSSVTLSISRYCFTVLRISILQASIYRCSAYSSVTSRVSVTTLYKRERYDDPPANSGELSP